MGNYSIKYSGVPLNLVQACFPEAECAESLSLELTRQRGTKTWFRSKGWLAQCPTPADPDFGTLDSNFLLIVNGPRSEPRDDACPSRLRQREGQEFGSGSTEGPCDVQANSCCCLAGVALHSRSSSISRFSARNTTSGKKARQASTAGCCLCVCLPGSLAGHPGFEHGVKNPPPSGKESPRGNQ